MVSDLDGVKHQSHYEQASASLHHGVAEVSVSGVYQMVYQLGV